MIGLGTVINMGLIIGGSIIGLTCGRFMKDNLKQTLMVVCGIIVLLLGMSGAMQFMLVIVNGSLQTTGPLLMIISMVVGAVIGEIIDLDRWITALAHVAAPLMTQQAIDNLSYVGSILIFCVGINMIWPNKIRLANLLPAIFIAMGLTFLI